MCHRTSIAVKDDLEAVCGRRGSSTAANTLVEVVATGIGNDKEAARKDALREAVAQVVGALVVTRSEVDNDELIASKILT